MYVLAAVMSAALLMLSACSGHVAGPPTDLATGAVPAAASTGAARLPIEPDVIAVGIVKSQVGAEVKVGS